MKFKVGDEIEFLGCDSKELHRNSKLYFMPKYSLGIIKRLYLGGHPQILVEFETEHKRLHGGNIGNSAVGKDQHCWWVFEYEIQINLRKQRLEKLESIK